MWVNIFLWQKQVIVSLHLWQGRADAGQQADVSIAAGMLPSAELIGDIVGCHQHWDQAECAMMVRCVTVGTYRQSKVGAKTCVYLLLSFLSTAATNIFATWSFRTWRI